MAVDAHTHVTENGQWFGFEHDASLETLLSEMKSAKIEKAVVISLEPFISNSFVGETCRQHPGKLLPVGSVNFLGKNFEQTFFGEVQRHELRGLKLHPKLQRLNINKPAVTNLVKNFSKQFGLPVVIDTWLGEDEPERLEYVKDLVDGLPDTSFVLAHSGGFLCKKAVEFFAGKENVFFELSFTLNRLQSSDKEKLLHLLNSVPKDRLIYGSDFPEGRIKESLQSAKEFFSGNGFDMDWQQLVLGKNIMRLLGQ